MILLHLSVAVLLVDEDKGENENGDEDQAEEDHGEDALAIVA